MKHFISQARKNHYLQNIYSLLSGSIWVQVAGLASYPIFARIFEIESFGEYAVYISILLIVGSVSTLKLERALFLPTDKTEVFDLYKLSIYFLGLISVLGFVVSLVYCFFVSDKYWVLTLGLSVFFEGFQRATEQLFLRENRIKTVSLSLKIQAFSQFTITLFFGYFINGFWGLVLGQILGSFFKGFVYWKELNQLLLTSDKIEYQLDAYKTVLKKYAHFPLYSIPSNWLNITSKEVTPLILVSFFSVELLGFYAMAQKLIRIIPSVIYGPFSGIFVKNAAEKIRNNEPVFPFVLKNTLVLFGISILCAVLFYFLPDEIYVYLLGSKWNGISVYIRTLIPWLIILIPYSTISNLFDLTNKLRLEMILFLFVFLVRIGVIYYFSTQHDFTGVLLWSSVATLILNGLSLVYLLRLTKKT